VQEEAPAWQDVGAQQAAPVLQHAVSNGEPQQVELECSVKADALAKSKVSTQDDGILPSASPAVPSVVTIPDSKSQCPPLLCLPSGSHRLRLHPLAFKFQVSSHTRIRAFHRHCFCSVPAWCPQVLEDVVADLRRQLATATIRCNPQHASAQHADETAERWALKVRCAVCIHW